MHRGKDRWTERVSDEEGTSLANENFSRLQDRETKGVPRFGCSTAIRKHDNKTVRRPSCSPLGNVASEHCCRKLKRHNLNVFRKEMYPSNLSR